MGLGVDQPKSCGVRVGEARINFRTSLEQALKLTVT